MCVCCAQTRMYIHVCVHARMHMCVRVFERVTGNVPPRASVMSLNLEKCFNLTL